MRRRFAALGFVLAAGLGGGSATPHAEVVFDGTLGPLGTLSGVMQIDETYGQRVGTNLFHSFDTFSVSQGESATFASAYAGVTDNIIGRVTGAGASLVDGPLGSTIPGASLWLINPNGWVFGADASLDVDGGVHVSTADYLLLDDGGRFDAADPAGTVLTMAPPAAFGFLGANGGISVDGATLEVAAGEPLSLVGGDIDVSAAQLLAPGGRIGLASAAGAGSIAATTFVAEGVDTFGNIRLDGANVETTAASGGDILILGGQFVADNSSTVTANTTGADPGDHGGDIDLTGNDVRLLTGSQVSATSYGAGHGGDVTLRVSGDVTVQGADAALIPAGVFANAHDTGSAGNLSITAANLSLVEGAAVTTLSSSSGATGDLTIDVADTLYLRSSPASFNADLLVSAETGSGDVGVLKVNAANVVMEGGALLQAKNAEGAPGLLAVDAGSIRLSGASQMSTSTDGAGPGSPMRLTADSIVLDGYQITPFGTFTTGLFASSASTASGAGGLISIDADSLTVSNYAEITGSTFGAGDAGSVVIHARDVDFAGGNIYANTLAFATGDGGDVDIFADTLDVTNGSFIGATSYSIGRAGDVTLDVRSAIYIEGAPGTYTGIFANAFWNGDAGSISITTPDLEVQQGGFIQSGTFPFANNQYGTGPIQIGNGGDIVLNVERLLVDAAFVSTRTETSGQSGAISVNATDSVTLRNSTGLVTSRDPIGGLLVSAGGLINLPGALGGAGSIVVNTPDLVIEDGGVIAADTFLAGDAGNISIVADRVDIASSESSLTGLFNNTASEGNAGTITIEAGDFRLAGPASIQAASFAAGQGGSITIDAERLELVDGGTVSSAASASGSGGNVRLHGRIVEILDGATASASSTGQGDAGELGIVADEALRIVGGTVETSSDLSAGGNVAIAAGSLLFMDGGVISAAASGVTPGDDGGNVDIDPDFVVLRQSQILATANAGNGGNIGIRAGTFVLDAGSVIDASSSTGLDGDVAIDSPHEVTGEIVPLAEPAAGLSIIAVPPCALRGGVARSTLTAEVGVRGAPAPDDYLASPSSVPTAALAEAAPPASVTVKPGVSCLRAANE